MVFINLHSPYYNIMTGLLSMEQYIILFLLKFVTLIGDRGASPINVFSVFSLATQRRGLLWT